MIDVMKRSEEIGFLPVIKLAKPQRDARLLAAALIAGGIPAAEVTFRAAGADLAIKLMRDAFPEMLVGAGTVLTMEQAKRAVEAGAMFLVSPGLDANIVRYAQAEGIAVFPGAVTPTEIQAAMNLDLSVVKFFPAEQYGGIQTIKALSAPFSNIRFVPTGGVNLANLGHYAQLPCVLACGGSYMVTDELLETANWEEITRLSQETRRTIDLARNPILF